MGDPEALVSLQPWIHYQPGSFAVMSDGALVLSDFAADNDFTQTRAVLEQLA
ncbi:hypothetical protein JYK14_08215 [Siccirubricoccus sp. KC 17139]|uniref:Uncharacterized protein n=1 Tax=Siccirubricoccus soli TaxID=2899147 RepID=A0ABT1D2L4_9PROT|nr:hypothetical protein [Siccirubricoccus soli]MCO6416150.1 hypothetical protein [Siccirubricoccus soli]MCP2682284.1 hypothetical protein [Siccirubricoccus soli]